MCGIVGIVGDSPVNQALFDALTVVQHRGQDAAGIMTCDANNMLHLRKEKGLLADVVKEHHIRELTGNMGIGHVRYPTAGCDSSAEAQPFYVNAPYGISLAHNGNLVNSLELQDQLFRQDRRHINTRSDSEILLNVLALELQKVDSLELSVDDIFSAVARVHKRVSGGYAVIAMITGRGILGFRDPYAIRPICFGRREGEFGTEFMVASESVALNTLGFELIRDLAPGEAVFLSAEGTLHTRQCAENPVYSPCIFEYVYLARPDSIIDDVSVYSARARMGERLARKLERTWPDHDIDVVIPIPETSRTSALELANVLGLTYREGFVKNRYIGRTFIMPGQSQRRKSVRHKLNAIDLEFRDKNVLLVDDSIVRGTTSRQIIQMAREAGARRVYMAIAAPPVRYPNVYGIDMPAFNEFVAHGRDIDEIAREICADRLLYQDLDDLIEAVRVGNPSLHRFDTSCFSGEYVTGNVTPDYLTALESERAALRDRRASCVNDGEDGNSALDLYNNH